MNSRRNFLKASGALAVGSMFLPNFADAANLNAREKMPELQLYTVRKEMLEDNVGTLKKIAGLGYKEIESAGSDKGYYYGLKPSEIKKITKDLGMTLRSGHVHYDDKWQQTIDEAAESGQEYLIVSVNAYKGPDGR